MLKYPVLAHQGNLLNLFEFKGVSEILGALSTELQTPKDPAGFEPATTRLIGEVTETVAPKRKRLSCM